MEKYYIGIDVGGSFTKAGLIKGGEIIYRTQISTKLRSLESIYSVVDEIINTTKVTVSGIGIGIAGMVLKQRILLSATNLGLENIDVASEIENKYHVDTKISNDVSCFAMAEAKQSNCENLVYITLGTGINIGVINQGKLFAGADGASLEYGHTCFCPMHRTAQPCSCGLVGCVEQFVSGKALMMFGNAAGIAATRPEEVFSQSKDIADGFISCLSTMILNIANSYRPQKIFIGGGLAAMVEGYIEMLNNELRSKNYGYKNAPAISVEISKLSTDGGIFGAVSLFN